MKIDADSLCTDLSLIREMAPVVHNITNYVVMNNTANALLALGASPVMAHSPDEVAEMVGIASALVLNIGTLSAPWVEAMLLAGHAARAKGIPVVLDPVGAGATRYRTSTATALLDQCRPGFVRGNASEILTLAKGAGATKGVDSTADSQAAVDAAKALATSFSCVVTVSGETDYITDGQDVAKVPFGHPMMPKVTGLGCTATALTAAFAAVTDEPCRAAAHAMVVMGICGELAAAGASGPGSFQVGFIDGLYNLSDSQVRAFLGGNQ